MVFNNLLFLKFCLALSVLEKLKYRIFEILIIPKTLNITNQRTTSVISINRLINRKPSKYYLKKFFKVSSHPFLDIVFEAGPVFQNNFY